MLWNTDIEKRVSYALYDSLRISITYILYSIRKAKNVSLVEIEKEKKKNLNFNIHLSQTNI